MPRSTKITNPQAAKVAGLRGDTPHPFATTPATPDAIRPKAIPASRQIVASDAVKITNPKADQIARNR